MITHVSNPLRSPRFRTSASVEHQRIAYAFGVPSGICEFNLYSRNSILLLLTLARLPPPLVSPPLPKEKGGGPEKKVMHIPIPGKTGEGRENADGAPPTCPLRPVIANNARPPCITAAAGTELAGTAPGGFVTILPPVKVLQPIEPSSPMRYSWIKLSPIVQDSSLLPPEGVWAVSQSQCG